MEKLKRILTHPQNENLFPDGKSILVQPAWKQLLQGKFFQ